MARIQVQPSQERCLTSIIGLVGREALSNFIYPNGHFNNTFILIIRSLDLKYSESKWTWSSFGAFGRHNDGRSIQIDLTIWFLQCIQKAGWIYETNRLFCRWPFDDRKVAKWTWFVMPSEEINYKEESRIGKAEKWVEASLEGDLIGGGVARSSGTW